MDLQSRSYWLGLDEYTPNDPLDGDLRADIALVGGHTEVTTAVTQTVVVGQMLGFAPDRHFVPTGGARPGHAIVQVGLDGSYHWQAGGRHTDFAVPSWFRHAHASDFSGDDSIDDAIDRQGVV